MTHEIDKSAVQEHKFNHRNASITQDALPLARAFARALEPVKLVERAT